MLKCGVRKDPGLHKCSHAVSATQRPCCSPEDLQCTIWTLQSCTEQLHSGILQVIVTQVQLCQTVAVRAENWPQKVTAFLCQITAIHPEGGGNKETQKVT